MLSAMYRSVFAVSETWFNEESNWRTGLKGFKVDLCGRKEKIGGGLAIWVKDSIASREKGWLMLRRELMLRILSG